MSILFVALLMALPTGVRAAMVEVGEPGPPMRVHDLDGSVVDLGEEAPDRALLVMFCTVGCVPCRESEPVLAGAGEALSGRVSPACVMLAEPDRVRAMLEAHGEELPPLRFLSDTAGEGLFPVAGAYGVLGTPTTFLVGRDGRVLWRRVGRLTRQHLDQDIPAALEMDGVPGEIASSRPLPTAD